MYVFVVGLEKNNWQYETVINSERISASEICPPSAICSPAVVKTPNFIIVEIEY